MKYLFKKLFYLNTYFEIWETMESFRKAYLSFMFFFSFSWRSPSEF